MKRWFSAAPALIAAAHVIAYLESGWIARTILHDRTLDGRRQPAEAWVPLLHGIILRSGVVTTACFAMVILLASIRRTREALGRFFEDERGPLDLAVFRVVFFGAFFLVFDADQTIFFSRLPRVLVQGLPDPLPLHRLLVPLPSVTPFLAHAFLAFCFLGMIGLFTRAAALAVVILGFYLLGLPQVFGKVDHTHHLLWFALILALSPCADTLSVDSLLRSFRTPDDQEPPRPSRAYALPIRVLWVLFGVLYFWPGFWKIVQHGPAWVLADNFKAHLYKKWFEEETFSPLFRIDHYPILCTLGASFTILFELGFIFLVPFKATRKIAVLVGMSFHLLTYFFMAIAFLSLQICYAVFFDWTRIAKWLEDHVFPADGAVRQRARLLLARVRAMGRQEARRPMVAAAIRFVTSAPSHERSIRSVATAGIVIATISMGYGAMHQTDAWPFACYPTFSTLIHLERRSLSLEIEDEHGARRRVRTASLIDAFRSERWSAVLDGVVRETRPDRRAAKLDALAEVIRGVDRSIKPGETIVIRQARFSTEPEAERRPLDTKTLYTYHVGATPDERAQ
jgi:hypothetical protein